MGANRAEAIPHTTSFVSTDRATEAARAPSDPKGGSKTSNTRIGKPRPTSRGHFAISPSCLASDHRQPMGVTMYSFGILGCVATRQLAVQPASSHTGAVTDFRPRDSKSPQKNAIESTVSTKGFFSSMFTVPKNRWRLETDNQSQVPQFLPGSLSFQNGEQRKSERCITGRRLHGKDRPRGCLPFSASSSGTSRFPEVLLETKNVPVQIPTIQPGYSTKSLHEISACGPS